MSYQDTCRQCGRTFRNSTTQGLEFCSIGCKADSLRGEPRAKTHASLVEGVALRFLRWYFRAVVRAYRWALRMIGVRE